MSIIVPAAISRRQLLMAGGAMATARLLHAERAVAAQNTSEILGLKPTPGLAPIMGAGQAKTPVLAYDGIVSGPICGCVRARRSRPMSPTG